MISFSEMVIVVKMDQLWSSVACPKRLFRGAQYAIYDTVQSNDGIQGTRNISFVRNRGNRGISF